MTYIPAWANPSCDNIEALAFLSGAVIHATSLDLTFVGMGAPPPVHWALGGVGADYYCKGAFAPDQRTAMAAAAGFAGGMVSLLFMP